MPRLEPLADPRISRGLAVLLAVLLLVLCWAGLVQPLLGLLRGDSPIAAKAQLIEEQRRVAERQPRLSAEKAALLQSEPDLADFLPGASTALAGADLQGRLGNLVKPLGGVIASVEPLAFPDDEGFHRAGLRMKLSLRQESLPPLLYALETGQPRLFLAALGLKSGGDGDLAVTMDLFGYLAPETP